MKLSTRNYFKETIKKVEIGMTNAEITLEIAPDVEIVSVITKNSAERLGLAEGKEAYAFTKSTDIELLLIKSKILYHYKNNTMVKEKLVIKNTA